MVEDFGKRALNKIVYYMIKYIMKTLILIKILNRTMIKTQIIVTILKRNQFFLSYIIIYIIYIRKLHNFLK